MHGTLMASKHREPNGRHQRDREFAPTQVKRLRDAALAGLRDPEWGTELGRLFLNNVLTGEMYAAGKRWREWARRYHVSIMVAPVRSTTGERMGHTHPPDPDSTEGQKIAKRDADHADKFAKALAILNDTTRVVRRVCEDGTGVDNYEELLQLRTGLLRLAAHWNLTNVRKSAMSKP